MTDGMNRRRFLKVLGATGGASVALSACGAPQPEKLIPYLMPVEDQVPGVPTWYASTCRECAAGCGVHVRVREGRAIKLEGNPDHPINQGKLCARGQAALQGLYNPDRIRQPLARGADGGFAPIAWDDAITRVADQLAKLSGGQIRFITGNENGTFRRLVGEWLSAYGSDGRLVYEPFAYEALRQATREVFGSDQLPWYDLAAARLIVSFGADFLETWVSPLEYTRGFTAAHAFANGTMGRLVHIEPRMSLTGVNADQWIAPAPGTEGVLALAMANYIAQNHLGHPPADVERLRAVLAAYTPQDVAERCDVPAETITTLAHEFATTASVAVCGGVGSHHADAGGTAAAVHLLNYVAGNVGTTLILGPDPDPAGGATYQRLTELVTAMQDGAVAALLVHGANPAYATPAALGFSEALRNVAFKVSFARFMDETAAAADLILPDHDPLEQWNDFEPRAGLHLLQQPVMQPVFETRHTGDVLLQVAQKAGGRAAQRFSAATYKDYLQEGWRRVQAQMGDRGAFDEFWRMALERGGVWREPPRRPVSLAAGATRVSLSPPPAPEGRFALIAYPSSVFYDGRAANRPWLQELPDPVSKITWSSWVEIHPDTAKRLGIEEGDVVEVTSDVGAVQAPAFLYPGIRRDVVAMPLGQGHTHYGRYAEGRGANPYALLAAQPAPYGAITQYAAVTIRSTGAHEFLATNAGSRRQLGRGIAQGLTLAAMTARGFEPEQEQEAAPVPERNEDAVEGWQEMQYHDWENRGNYGGEHPRWGMAIDLSKCTGCSACVTACYAENNLAVVGKTQVQHGREMSWMRIERYFEGGDDGPVAMQVLPMLCQQCYNAPCEPVCPVFAAYHTADGLNGQVYNRCVGTRYCSNNCPYKVRYFNWYDYQNPADPAFSWPAPLHWQLNPDVTVRAKGVMEKCTFCVQRIRGAQHEARMRGTPLRDGEIQTACQQSCPAEAIVFGDLRDPDSRVARLATDRRGYHVLEGLNTRPGITYLAKVRNPLET